MSPEVPDAERAFAPPQAEVLTAEKVQEMGFALNTLYPVDVENTQAQVEFSPAPNQRLEGTPIGVIFRGEPDGAVHEVWKLELSKDSQLSVGRPDAMMPRELIEGHIPDYDSLDKEMATPAEVLTPPERREAEEHVGEEATEQVVDVAGAAEASERLLAGTSLGRREALQPKAVPPLQSSVETPGESVHEQPPEAPGAHTEPTRTYDHLFDSQYNGGSVEEARMPETEEQQAARAAQQRQHADGEAAANDAYLQRKSGTL